MFKFKMFRDCQITLLFWMKKRRVQNVDSNKNGKWQHADLKREKKKNRIYLSIALYKCLSTIEALCWDT